MTYEIYEFKNHEWAYRITAENGNILIHSEGYDSKNNAKRAIREFLEEIIDDISSVGINQIMKNLIETNYGE